MTLHAYRASAELAAALRDYKARVAAFWVDVDAFNAEHPGHEILWRRSPFSADSYPVGFADGTDEVPSGLSRAKSRPELRPRNGRTGAPWRDVLERMNNRPSVSTVLRRYGVREHGDGPGTGTGGHYIAPTQWIDAGDDGVLVVCKYDIGVDRNGEPDLSAHLTPMPLSEFYRITERLEAEQAAAS